MANPKAQMPAQSSPNLPDDAEIDEIMNDIGKLQQGIAETTAPAKSASSSGAQLKVVPAASAPETPGSDDSFSGASLLDMAIEADTQPTSDVDPTLATPATPFVDAENSDLGEIDPEIEAQVAAEIEAAAAEIEAKETPRLKAPARQEYAASRQKDSAEESGCLSMTLTGSMTLRLKYEYEGNEVTIGFADQALRVQLSDGTEFKVPVGRGTPNKR